MLIHPLVCLDAGGIDQALVSLLATCLSRSIGHLEWKWSCADDWTEASTRSLICWKNLNLTTSILLRLQWTDPDGHHQSGLYPAVLFAPHPLSLSRPRKVHCRFTSYIKNNIFPFSQLVPGVLVANTMRKNCLLQLF
jgi:hypothetical protein